MRLSEALTILQKSSDTDAPRFGAVLVCGFMPLHLKSFLAAHLQLALPQRRIEVQTGLYGDFIGTLEKLSQGGPLDCAVVLIEWTDLDARLGLRSLGGWRLTDFTEILEHVQARLALFAEKLERAAEVSPVALSLPTLPLPPIQPTLPPWNAGPLDLQLRERLYAFAVRLEKNTRIKIVSPGWLDLISPPGDRLDVKSEMSSGFPYKLPHADAVAGLLSRLVQNPAPKKGIITDLDNTLWKGILGEIGADQISWDLDHKSHLHALYQEMLRSLASTGVLIAVASKNEQAQVDEAFARRDLIVGREHIFPFQVHWGPKSGSVAQILEAWNVGAESVVFVDDSPTELAEVKASHPEIECLQFPADPQEIYNLVARLRSLFAKGPVSEEDAIRLASIRSMHRLRADGEDSGPASETFLEQAQSELTISLSKTPWDPRVLELINKTNQFNLNGIRYTENDLRGSISHSNAFVLKTSYQDKYGVLGKIAVMLGRLDGGTLHIDSWVMSCRAFSRHIEHACLDHLFKTFGVEQIGLEFAPTAKNKPLQDFLAEIYGTAAEPGMRISKTKFYDKCPRLYHRVQEEVNG
jgi:FkbH-like protein